MRCNNSIRFIVQSFIVGTLFSLLSTATFAVSIHPQVSYYDVEGSELSQLRLQIKHNAPIVAGKHYPILAVYKFDWQSKVIREGSLCRALSPNLDISVKLTMPRWISQSRSDFATQQAWIVFVASSQQYLQQINSIVEQSGDRFIAQVNQLPNSSCSKLNALVDAKGRAALANANQKLRSYQRQTQYGLTLGLKLP